MNYEEARLCSFERWPSDIIIDARSLAQAGFYYVGEGLEVQCFSCGKRISGCDLRENMNEKHQMLEPDCIFLSNSPDSGNIPQLSFSSPADVSLQNPASNSSPSPEDASSQSSTDSSYLVESTRLDSFEDWPIPAIVSPEALARAGFYYMKQGDMVRCAFCQGLVCKWEVGDDPIREHRKLFPSCRFLESLSATRSSDSTDCPPGVDIRESESSCESTNLRELGVQSHKVPKHPAYATVESRLRTYTHWPRKQSLKPGSLAEAGFFYLGCDDHVRCFHCDGGLKLWDPTDDPWKEHARWFSDCGFILLVKGEEFVKEATVAKPPVYPCSIGMLFKKERESLERRFKEIELKQRMRTPRQRRPPTHRVSSEQLRALMDSPQARAVILLGLEASRVKMAIKEKLERTGTTYASADALATAALNIQHEEMAQSELEEAWTTPPESPMMNWIHQSMSSEMLRGRRDDSSPDADNDTHSTSSSSSDHDLPQGSEHHSTSSSISSSSSSRLEEGLINLSDRIRACNQSESGVRPSSSSASVPGCSSSKVLESSSKSNLDDPCRTVSLEEENRLLKEARLCKICMDNEVRIVFLPCGHLVTCARCATSLPACPVCRQPIKATVKTFLS